MKTAYEESAPNEITFNKKLKNGKQRIILTNNALTRMLFHPPIERTTWVFSAFTAVYHMATVRVPM